MANWISELVDCERKSEDLTQIHECYCSLNSVSSADPHQFSRSTNFTTLTHQISKLFIYCSLDCSSSVKPALSAYGQNQHSTLLSYYTKENHTKELLCFPKLLQSQETKLSQETAQLICLSDCQFHFDSIYKTSFYQHRSVRFNLKVLIRWRINIVKVCTACSLDPFGNYLDLEQSTLYFLKTIAYGTLGQF